MNHVLIRIIVLFAALWGFGAPAQDRRDYTLAAGDTLRIQVFQSPDLTTETRVSENGMVTFPLIGQVQIGGQSAGAAERRIAAALETGGFVRNPQVTIFIVQMRGNQVSVLGQVARPGRFPLENMSTRLSDLLATAGGIVPGGGSAIGGDDVVVVTGMRDGKPFRREIDIPSLYMADRAGEDLVVSGGDTIYVPRAPVYYIYGEAQRPGAYRVERGMTVMQALAVGGGITNRGTESRVRVHRRSASGAVEQLSPQMTDRVQPGDVIYVRESLF